MLTFEELEPWLEKALDIVKIVEVVLLSIINHRIGKTEAAVVSASSQPAETPTVSAPEQVPVVMDTSTQSSCGTLRRSFEEEYKKALDLYFSDKKTEEMTAEELETCAKVTKFMEAR